MANGEVLAKMSEEEVPVEKTQAANLKEQMKALRAKKEREEAAMLVAETEKQQVPVENTQAARLAEMAEAAEEAKAIEEGEKKQREQALVKQAKAQLINRQTEAETQPGMDVVLDMQKVRIEEAIKDLENEKQDYEKKKAENAPGFWRKWFGSKVPVEDDHDLHISNRTNLLAKKQEDLAEVNRKIEQLKKSS